MIKNRLLPILALVIVIGGVMYIWSPWKGRQMKVDLRNAGEIIKSAQIQTRKAANYKYKTDITIGEEIKIEVLNRVVKADQKQQLADFAWDIPKMSGATSMYTKGEELFIYHPLQDKWLQPGEEPTLKPFIEFFGKQLELVDPVTSLLKIDPARKNLAVLSGEEIPDSSMVGVQVIPGADAVAEMTKALPPQVSRGRLTAIKQVFWIARKDLLVSRYELRASVSIFGLKTMDFKVEAKVLDYNNTKINLPKKLTDKLNQ